MTDLQKMTLLNGKHPWDVATLCCSLCWIQVCQTLRSFLSKWLTLLLLALILLKDPTISYGAQTQETYLKTCQMGLPGDYFYSPMQQQGSGQTIKKQSAQLTPPVEEPAAACPKKWLTYLHEMRASETGIQIRP